MGRGRRDRRGAPQPPVARPTTTRYQDWGGRRVIHRHAGVYQTPPPAAPAVNPANTLHRGDGLVVVPYDPGHKSTSPLLDVLLSIDGHSGPSSAAWEGLRWLHRPHHASSSAFAKRVNDATNKAATRKRQLRGPSLPDFYSEECKQLHSRDWEVPPCSQDDWRLRNKSSASIP